MQKKSIFQVLLLGSVLAMSACIPSKQTGTTYSRNEARTVQNIQIGRVLDVTAVTIEGTKTGLGGVVGGAVGGIAGNSVNNGVEGDIAAVLVGAAGALIGAKAEEAFTKATGTEYTLRLENGKIISVVQANDEKAEAIVAGDTVKLLSQGTTFRVTKTNAAAYQE